MSQRQESVKQTERKNQKNIYVHKINSLMKISQQNLLEDQRQINSALNKQFFQNLEKRSKKFALKVKFVQSVNKNALKLQKNRESAKRARLRKKLYIKLLQSQVDRLKQVAKEGQRIEKDAQKFLKMISIKEQANQSVYDEVQRYLSRDNLGDAKNVRNKLSKNEHERQGTSARLDKLIEEICQLSMSSPLRNIRELSSQISLDEILRGEQPQKESQELQEIIKGVLIQSEQLRQFYMQIMKQNQKVKRLIEEDEIKRQQFVQDFHLYSQVIPGDRSPQKLKMQSFKSYLRPPNQPSNIFINLSEAEKILIQANSFLALESFSQQL